MKNKINKIKYEKVTLNIRLQNLQVFDNKILELSETINDPS